MGLQVGHLFVRYPTQHWCVESRTQIIQVLVVRPTQEAKDYKGEKMIDDPEKDAFNHVEMLSRVKQEAVKAQLKSEEPAKLESQEPIGYLCENAVGHKYFRWKKPPSTYKPIALYAQPTRNDTIEEVAQHIEKMRGFGNDTISSFAIFIRGMKR
jgi:hypothetical protein